jgi:hypothetical protein
METPSERIKRGWITRRKNGNNIPYNKLPIPPRDLLKDLYCNQKKSSRQIAKIINSNQRRVMSWLELYKIPRRGYNENPCPTRGKHLSKLHRKKISIGVSGSKNGSYIDGNSKKPYPI